MNLDEIANGEPVVVDSNIIIYGIRNKSAQCQRLLRRAAGGEIQGRIAVHILAEIMHQLMIAEAREYGWVTGSNPSKQLSERPDRAKMLSRYEQSMSAIFTSGLTLESLVKEDFLTCMRLQRETGLLTNDALLLAVAERLSIPTIASADKSFRNVEWVTLYLPDDLTVT